MRCELEYNLAEEFPFMKKKSQAAEGIIDDLYSAFGCECGDGWYEVIRGLCMAVTKFYVASGEPIDLTVSQVKEKYGTLRFYYNLENNHTQDFYDGLREIVRFWEEKSAFVCEECGKRGELRKDLPWILTLCDDCHKKQKQKVR